MLMYMCMRTFSKMKINRHLPSNSLFANVQDLKTGLYFISQCVCNTEKSHVLWKKYMQ